MALIQIHFYSQVLGRQTNIQVIIPQRNTYGEIGVENNANENKYKTLLLLHGLSDDNTIWARRTSIERYATERGIAVVMPDGERGFYTDNKHGYAYYKFISEDVLRIAREFLPLSAKREDTFVAGNSMGGYGALKIALKNPETYSAAIGLSSVADVEKFMNERTPDLKEIIFGGERVPADEDLFELAKACEKNSIKPRLYMCEGKDDFMYEENVRLKTLFERLDYDFTYVEDEGAHEWGFWDKHIKKGLAWLLG